MMQIFVNTASSIVQFSIFVIKFIGIGYESHFGCLGSYIKHRAVRPNGSPPFFIANYGFHEKSSYLNAPNVSSATPHKMPQSSMPFNFRFFSPKKRAPYINGTTAPERRIVETMEIMEFSEESAQK